MNRVGDMSQKTGSQDDEHQVALAGPMLQQDGLHAVNLVLSTVTFVLSLLGLLLPEAGYIIDSGRKESGEIPRCYFSMITVTVEESISCPNKEETSGELVAKPSANVAFLYLPLISMIICGIGLIVQVVNFVLGLSQKRNYTLHKSCELIYFLAGSLLLVSGHLASYEAIGTQTSVLRPSPVFGGLTYMAVVMCAWVGVQIHVASHAPGILSLNTRFMHIYDTKPSVAYLPTNEQLDLNEEVNITTKKAPAPPDRAPDASTEI